MRAHRIMATGILVLGLPLGVNAQTLGPCEGQWLPGSPVAGADSVVRASIVWDRDGEGPLPEVVVIAGDFHVVGNALASHIAMWDGNAWESFGAGMDATVHALTSWNGDLVAGGDFTMTDNNKVNRVAKWDGTTWQPIGLNLNGWVRALAVLNGELIAAGRFPIADTSEVDLVKKWDGTSWVTVGTNLSQGLIARHLVVVDDDLFVGGSINDFKQGIYGIARWDGVEWSGLGLASGTQINGLGRLGSQFVASGTLRLGEKQWHLATWDGQQWDVVGGDINGVATCFAENGDGLVVAGCFDSAGGRPFLNIAHWNGTQWDAIGDGLQCGPWCLSILGAELIAGGSFDTAGGQPANNVALWDGTHWSAMSAGLTSAISEVTAYDNQIIAGGHFNVVGEIGADNLARWTGLDWQPIQSNFVNVVNAICVHDGKLIASGQFGIGVGHASVEAWDGERWEPLTTYMNWAAHTLLPFGEDLIAIGVFGNISNVIIDNGIAIWDGSTWQQYGTLIAGLYASVRAATIYNDELVIGGESPWFILRWDGTQWQGFGAGVNNAVSALVTFNGELIAAGSFTVAGGVPAKYIAKWDGSQWQPFGTGANAKITRLGVHKGQLIVTGDFTMIDGVQANRIARWDGSHWQPLGTGMTSGGISGIVSFGDELIVAGEFGAVGGSVSAHFARWNSTGVPVIAIQPQSTNSSCVPDAHFVVVVASGYDDISYRWRLNGIPLVDGATQHGSIIQGATTPSLKILTPNTNDAGIYDVMVYNECGETVSETAVLAVGACGDISGDGVVNVNDLLALINAWGACTAPCPADIAPSPYGDGVVNVLDLLMVIDNWG